MSRARSVSTSRWLVAKTIVFSALAVVALAWLTSNNQIAHAAADSSLHCNSSPDCRPPIVVSPSARLPRPPRVVRGVKAIIPASHVSERRPRPTDSTSRSTTCAPNGTWPGPYGYSYLNEFYTGQTDSNGNCTYYIASQTWTSWELTTTYSPYYMESDIVVQSGGGGLLVDPGVVLHGLSGNMYIHGSVSFSNSAWVTQFYGSIIIYDAAIMTLDSNVVIEMSSFGCAIWADGGIFDANGTSASPDVVTSSQSTPAPGDWTGIEYTTGPGGLPGTGDAEYLVESYAGHGFSSGGITYHSGIAILGSTSAPTIHHSSIESNAGNGAEIANGATGDLVGDAFSNNVSTALQYDYAPTDLSQLSGLSVSGNGQNVIAIGESDYSGTGTWPNLGVPYLLFGVGNGHLGVTAGSQLTFGAGATFSSIADSLDVQSGGQLTMGAGVTIVNMELNITVFSGATLAIGPGVSVGFTCGGCRLWVNGGTLNANGTAAQPIVLTSGQANPKPGDWQGVVFEPGASGSLYDVNESYAGANVYVDGAHYYAGILVINSSPTIAHTNVSHSLGKGLEVGVVNSGSASPTLTNDSFTNNTDNALQYDFLPGDLSRLSGLTASGNGRDALIINDNCCSSVITTTGTYPAFGLPIQVYGNLTVGSGGNLTVASGVQVPYLLYSVTVNAGGTLTIQPGVMMAFTGGTSLSANGGALNLNGTATAPIGLTSAQTNPAPGDWQGVAFQNGGTGSLSYVNETYAGSGIGVGGTTYYASVLITGGGPTIAHSTITQSSSNDVEVANGALPVLRFNTYGAVPANHFGVSNDGWTSGQPVLDASYSWWGDPSGPTVASNPNGKGTPVTAGVSYSPWVGQAPGPVLALSASSGKAGNQVNVTGSGFATRELVNLYLGTTLVGTTQVILDTGIPNQPLGRISVTITVPSVAPGTYVLQAIGQHSGRFVLASFTITSSASRSRQPTHHPTGTPIASATLDAGVREVR